MIRRSRMALPDEVPRVGGAGKTLSAASRSARDAFGEHGERHHVPVEPDHRPERRGAELGGALHDGFEGRLHVGQRPGDDPQDVARRGLALQSFRQLSVPPLERLAQALVLEGDRRLVGEGPEERDLLRRERPDLKATDRDKPDGEVVAQQGDEQERAEPLAEIPEPGVSPLGGGGRDVMQVDRAALEDDPAGRQRRCDRDRLADWTHRGNGPLDAPGPGAGRPPPGRCGHRTRRRAGRRSARWPGGWPGRPWRRARRRPAAGEPWPRRRWPATSSHFVSWLHELPFDRSPEAGPAAPG